MTKVGCLNSVYCISVYRPPGPAAFFLSDFTDLSSSIIKLNRVIVVGDFNIHVDDVACNTESEFRKIIELLDLDFAHGLVAKNMCIEDFLVSDHSSL